MGVMQGGKTEVGLYSKHKIKECMLGCSQDWDRRVAHPGG